MKHGALTGFLLVIAFLLSSCNRSDQVIIGSKNFTEQVILGELLAQQIESKTNLKVDRRLNLGGTFICHQAIAAGQIDAYIEYTGTAFTAILKREPITDPQEVYRQVKEAYVNQFTVEWLRPLGFNNTFAIIVRGDDARRLNLKKISDAAPYTSKWRAGFGYEFMERADGFPGLSRTYNLQFGQPPRVMDLGLIYRAIADRQVDLVAGNSTDGLISALGLVVLEDDRHYFPPYEAVPIIRAETLKRHPELRAVIEQLGGLITEEEMRRLNQSVDGKHRDVKQVVSEFLRAKGL
jgi:osmoprotectant transport system substrate-binding protein